MKNGGGILLVICAVSLALVLGIFIGRNTTAGFAPILGNSADVSSAAPAEPADVRLDINSATQAQLMDLPGIGEMMSERIIAYRTENGGFTSTDELLKVDGIGQKKLQQIEHLIKVGG